MDNELKEILDNIQTEQEKQLPALSSQERRMVINEKVRNMILKGKSRPECMRFIQKESKRLGFENTESQSSKIYHQIKSELKSELSENRDEILADIATKLYWLYNQNIEKEDLKEARECIKEVAKLCGLGTNQVNIAKNDKGDEVININFGFSE